MLTSNFYSETNSSMFIASLVKIKPETNWLLVLGKEFKITPHPRALLKPFKQTPQVCLGHRAWDHAARDSNVIFLYLILH